MKQQSFIFWKELTREYVPGKDALVLSKREKKRLDAFLASLKPDVMMVVLSDEPVEGKQHMAYVKEHYNVGTIDASRLLVRPEFVMGILRFFAGCTRPQKNLRFMSGKKRTLSWIQTVPAHGMRRGNIRFPSLCIKIYGNVCRKNRETCFRFSSIC